MKINNGWYVVGLSLTILVTLTLFTGFRSKTEIVIEPSLAYNSHYLSVQDTILTRISDFSKERRKLELRLNRMDLFSGYEYTEDNYELRDILEKERDHLKNVLKTWQEQNIELWQTDSIVIQEELKAHDEKMNYFYKSYKTYHNIIKN